jgi:hypothetical protein
MICAARLRRLMYPTFRTTRMAGQLLLSAEMDGDVIDMLNQGSDDVRPNCMQSSMAGMAHQCRRR